MGVSRNALTKYFYFKFIFSHALEFLILDAYLVLFSKYLAARRPVPEADYYGGPCPSCMITARVLDPFAEA